MLRLFGRAYPTKISVTTGNPLPKGGITIYQKRSEKPVRKAFIIIEVHEFLNKERINMDAQSDTGQKFNRLELMKWLSTCLSLVASEENDRHVDGVAID